MKTPTNNDNLDQLFNKAKAGKQGLDDFEKDAIEGFDMLESEQEASDLKAALDTRIQKELFAKEEEKNPKVYWFAAAGLILVIGLTVLFIRNNNESLSNGHDVAIVNNVQESEKNVLPDSKVELKEQAIAPPTEAVTVSDEESPAKKSEGKLKLAKLDEQTQAAEKDMVASDGKIVEDEKEAKPRMIVAASKGPVDVKQFEKEKSERKKEEVADEIVATGSGTNSKNNAAGGYLDDLAKGSKDKEGEVFKSVTTKSSPDQKIKSAETESTPKNELAFGSPKEKAKKADRDDNDAEENLNQPVAVNMDKNATVNREEKAGKKSKRANNKQSSAGMVVGNNDYKPGSPNTTTTKDAIVLETTSGNTAAAETQIETIACYYTGGESAVTTDLRAKLKGKDIDQKFDATLFVNEKKAVEKVDYINSYDLTAKQKEEVTKILKTLCKFNFSVNPGAKGLFPYKVLYRP
ncbi:MAG: hypothetical protein JNJ41_10585 [Bacteroidia bacterium]|nr:hypothetical protein [Bacteroidia bacterium]